MRKTIKLSLGMLSAAALAGAAAYQQTAQPELPSTDKAWPGEAVFRPVPDVLKAEVYQGYLITNSGYGFAFKMPGNALLVYSIDGKLLQIGGHYATER